jgi:hypothetical protein
MKQAIAIACLGIVIGLSVSNVIRSLLGEKSVYTTPQTYAVAEALCVPHGGLARVEKLDRDMGDRGFFRTAPKLSAQVVCKSGVVVHSDREFTFDP